MAFYVLVGYNIINIYNSTFDFPMTEFYIFNAVDTAGTYTAGIINAVYTAGTAETTGGLFSVTLQFLFIDIDKSSTISRYW